MPLLNSFVSLVTYRRLNQIEYFKNNPEIVQTDMFRYLLQTSASTLWGKKYDYSKLILQGLKAFQDNVPISSYEDIRNQIERIQNGEKNVLWPTDIKFFAKSSGTTDDKSKFIPVSSESLENCHYRGGRDVLAIYNNLNPFNQLLKGKALVIGGSQQINKYDNEIFYGDLSAVLMSNLPLWVQLLRVPDMSIALLTEWEEKIEKMALSTINENVTNISGVPSWTLVLINRILEITGKKYINEVWPNLELFIHGGVSFEPYRNQYKQIISNPEMRYMETYNASEGFFALQDDLSSPDMLLMLDLGIFYEFIPVNEFGKPNAKAYPVWEVETGVNYALIISTNGGLWRYAIGDTVEFTSLKPYKIKITGRTKHFINAFGEELIIDNANIAIIKACQATGATVREFTAAPVYMQNNSGGKHQWLIEFDTHPDNLEKFTTVLDDILKQNNSDYEGKRHKNIALKAPEVIVAKPELFYTWLKNKGKLGGQHKIPRLANNRVYMDELISLNNTM